MRTVPSTGALRLPVRSRLHSSISASMRLRRRQKGMASAVNSQPLGLRIIKRVRRSLSSALSGAQCGMVYTQPSRGGKQLPFTRHARNMRTLSQSIVTTL